MRAQPANGWRCWMVGAMLAAAAASAAAQGASAGPAPAPEAAPRQVTLPFDLDHNRMIVDVQFIRPDGTVWTARAWVDTGNPDLLLGEALARDLGLEPAAPGESGTQYAQVWANRTPPLRLAGMPMDMAGIRTRLLPGAGVLPGVPAEANLPARALLGRHVVFDYPARRLIVAEPGVLAPRGAAVPCRVNATTGLFLVEAVLDGETVALGVDNGSAGTWVSDRLTKAWAARHPDRPRATGAAGSANFFGFPFEAVGELMRVSELGIGPLRVRNVAAFGIDQRLFDWYSQKSAGPVAGFIGANVLAGLRLEVDFPNGMTYWEAGPPPPADDLDIVGLTLRPESDGGYTVAGVVSRNGQAAVEGVRPGDRLLRVDALDTRGASMGAVVGALRGQPGATRRLVIMRDGQTVTVDAPVTRLP